MLRVGAQRTRVGSWRARVFIVLCGGVMSSCSVPSFNVRQVSAGDGSARDAAIGTSDNESDPQADAGRGGRDARAGRGGHGGDGGAGGRGAGVSGRKAERGGEGGAGEGGANGPEGGAGASARGGGGGGGGKGGSSGMPAAVGGSGGGVAGAAGSGGPPANEAPCRDWQMRSETDSFADLGPAPGNEMNTQTSVSQWLCRAKAPDGVVALGKAVPGFGCYATYESGNTRVGFGATKATGGFDVLVPNADCPLTWAAPGSGAIELGDALRACRGRLQNQMYPDGTASGSELGQWVVVGTTQQCWTQFHDANGNVDGGSLRLTENVEVLTRAQ